MTTFYTLASGSSGNAALLVCNSTSLLIDIGISCRRICQSLTKLDIRPQELTAIFISHEHGDHVKGLASFLKKYTVPVFCTPGTARRLSSKIPGLEPQLVPLGSTLRLPDVTADILPTSHDAGESSAFGFMTPDGRVAVLTDTGYIPEETGQKLLGADLLVLESNHDEGLLWAGPYPYYLKRRIQSEWGHLNNTDAAQYAAASARAGTKTVLLAHLSGENNMPQLALDTARLALEETGWTGCLDVAPRDSISRAYCLERSLCAG